MSASIVVSPEGDQSSGTRKAQRAGGVSLDTVLEIDPLKFRLEEVSRAVSQLCDNLDDGLESVVDKDLILSKTPFTRGGGLGGVDGDVCRGPIEVSPESNDGRHAHSNGRLTMQFDEAAYEDGGEYDQSSHASHHQSGEAAAAARAELEVARLHLKKVLAERQALWDTERQRLEEDWSVAMARKAEVEDARDVLQSRQLEMEQALRDAKAETVAQKVASEVALAGKQEAEARAREGEEKAALKADAAEALAVAEAVKRAVEEVGSLESELMRRDERLRFLGEQSASMGAELAASRRVEGSLQQQLDAMSSSLKDSEAQAQVKAQAETDRLLAAEREASKERLAVVQEEAEQARRLLSAEATASAASAATSAAAAVARADEDKAEAEKAAAAAVGAVEAADLATSQAREEVRQLEVRLEEAVRGMSAEQEGHASETAELLERHACALEQARLEAATAVEADAIAAAAAEAAAAAKESTELAVAEVAAAAALVAEGEEKALVQLEASVKAHAIAMADVKAQADAQCEESSAALESIRAERAELIAEVAQRKAQAEELTTSLTFSLTASLAEEHAAATAAALADCRAECEALGRMEVQAVEEQAAEAAARAAEEAAVTAAEAVSAAEEATAAAVTVAAAAQEKLVARAEAAEAASSLLENQVEHFEAALASSQQQREELKGVADEFMATAADSLAASEKALKVAEQARAELAEKLRVATEDLAQLKEKLEAAQGFASTEVERVETAASLASERAQKQLAEAQVANAALELELRCASEREGRLMASANELRGSLEQALTSTTLVQEKNSKGTEEGEEKEEEEEEERDDGKGELVEREAKLRGRALAAEERASVAEEESRVLAFRVVNVEAELAEALAREGSCYDEEATLRQALLETRAAEQGLCRDLSAATKRADDKSRAAECLRQVAVATSSSSSSAAVARAEASEHVAATLRELRAQVLAAHEQRVVSERQLEDALVGSERRDREQAAQEAARVCADRGVRASLEGRVEVHRAVFADLRAEVEALEAQLRFVERQHPQQQQRERQEKSQQQQQQQELMFQRQQQKPQLERDGLEQLSPEEREQFLEWRRQKREGLASEPPVEGEREVGDAAVNGSHTVATSKAANEAEEAVGTADVRQELQLKVCTLEDTVAKLRDQLKLASLAIQGEGREEGKWLGPSSGEVVAATAEVEKNDFSLVFSSPAPSGGVGGHIGGGSAPGGEKEEDGEERSSSTWLMHRQYEDETPLSCIGSAPLSAVPSGGGTSRAELDRGEVALLPGGFAKLSSVKFELDSPPCQVSRSSASSTSSSPSSAEKRSRASRPSHGSEGEEVAALAAKCLVLEEAVAAHEAAQAEVEEERARLAERHAQLDTLVRDVSSAAAATATAASADTAEESEVVPTLTALASSSAVASELEALRLLRQGFSLNSTRGNERSTTGVLESSEEVSKLRQQVAELKEKKAAYKVISRTHLEENRRLKLTITQQQQKLQQGQQGGLEEQALSHPKQQQQQQQQQTTSTRLEEVKDCDSDETPPEDRKQTPRGGKTALSEITNKSHHRT